MSKPSYEVFARYRQKAYKQLNVMLHVDHDKDIIDFLETVPSKQGFVKELIRREIEAGKAGITQKD